MNYKYEITSLVNHDVWDDSLKKIDYSSFFQAFQNIVSRSDDIISLFIIIKDQNGEIVGQLGCNVIKTSVMYSSKLLKKLNKIISKISSRIIWVYGPIIHSKKKQDRNEILRKILNAVDEIAKKYDVVHIEGQTPPCDFFIDEDYIDEFFKNNYSKYDHHSYISNLDLSIDELWKKISKKARGDVNRAKRRNIVIKELKEKDLDEFMKLNQEWAKTKGLEITDLDKEKEIVWENHKNGIEKIFLAYNENKLISGIRIGCFNKIAYTNFVINSYSDLTNLGGTQLTWNALKWAKENNFKFYDFSGGPDIQKEEDKNIHSLLFYKSKWGGRKIPYYVFIKIRKKLSYKIFIVLFKLLKLYHDRKRT